MEAQKHFSFIDPSFHPTLFKDKISFCPKKFQLKVWKLMNKHLYQHSLILMVNSQFYLQLKFELLQFKKFILFVKKIHCHGYEFTYGMNGTLQNAGFYGFEQDVIIKFQF